MKKILLAYDGGEPAQHALETAASLTLAFKAELTVVSVVPAHLAGSVEAAHRARQLQDAREALAELGVEAELLEPAGDPARKIEQIAEEGCYDTIVMGARRVSDLARALGGSVSTHVATHASSVVVLTH